VNGEKMSKSKGTFILASTFAEHVDPAALRYFYASKLGPKVDDIDLSFDEFVARVNAELVNKVVNLASRSARFVRESGLSAEYPDDGGLFAQGVASGEEIAKAYGEWDFARVTRLAMALADRANEYLDRAAPWTKKKKGGLEREVQDICSIALNLFRQIMVYLAPVLPSVAQESAKLLGCSLASWEDAATPLVGTPVAEYVHLMKRLDPTDVDAVIAASAAVTVPTAGVAAVGKTLTSEAEIEEDDDRSITAEPLAATCSIEDFQKVDLRVARVVAAEHVPDAKKLIKLTVSLGGADRRTVFAGIKAHHAPESLVGRLVVIVANLAPRKMKLGTSEGMVVAASGAGAEGVFLLSPDAGATPGMRLH
jgi:methionyl-tRNA synthetase